MNEWKKKTTKIKLKEKKEWKKKITSRTEKKTGSTRVAVSNNLQGRKNKLIDVLW